MCLLDLFEDTMFEQQKPPMLSAESYWGSHCASARCWTLLKCETVHSRALIEQAWLYTNLLFFQPVIYMWKERRKRPFFSHQFINNFPVYRPD